MEIILNCEDNSTMEEYSKILKAIGYEARCILDEETKDSNEQPTLRAIKKSKALFNKYNIVTISILKGMSEEIKCEEYLDNHKYEIFDLISASICNESDNIAFEFKIDGYARHLESSIKKALNKETFSKPNLSIVDKLYQMDYVVALRARRLRYMTEARKNYSSFEYAMQVNKILNKGRMEVRIKELSRKYEKKQIKGE